MRVLIFDFIPTKHKLLSPILEQNSIKYSIINNIEAVIVREYFINVVIMP